MAVTMSKGTATGNDWDKKAVPAPVINGYATAGGFPNVSGGARWDRAEKNGKSWFIKEFYSTVIPEEHAGLDEAYIKACRVAAEEFRQRKERMYGALRDADPGTLVTVTDFFLFGSKYYAVSPWLEDLSPAMSAVAAESEADKARLLKVLANSLARLHARHVVHGDLRPDNLMFRRSPSGKLTLKLIDFDSSFFEDELLEPEDLAVSPGFISPEVGRVVLTEESEPIDCKSDVFSAALLFHQLWCGEEPSYDKKRFDYPFLAILNGGSVSPSYKLPNGLRVLLAKMLYGDRDKRPTMAEVLRELQRIFPVLPPPPPEKKTEAKEYESASGLKIISSF